ncbi:SDR family oxidoreductase [Altericista sp. CCNU0014]|uniref:SDR family oxidoreductase n=1 Tax=Altericista sp. CCNU0014 TaxID=3082949 RepID=UPI00384CA5AF
MISPSSSQRALITGASRGIGKATALAFAKAGISSILIGRSPDSLQATAEEVRALGAEAIALSIDLSQVDRVKSQLEQVLETVGSADILVNNAGMGYTGGLLETSLADWQQVIDLNLTSPLQCIQAVLPQMRSRRSGTIINVISIAGRQTFPSWGAYCASKFGLMGMTKTLAQEERSYGIRVVALCPGAVDTPLWDTPTVNADFDRSLMLTPEDVADAIVHAALLPQHVVLDELVLMPNSGTF